MAQIFDWFDCIETTSVRTEVEKAAMDHGISGKRPPVLGIARCQ